MHVAKDTIYNIIPTIWHSGKGKTMVIIKSPAIASESETEREGGIRAWEILRGRL
jgi:hypothetical protein